MERRGKEIMVSQRATEFGICKIHYLINAEYILRRL